MKQNSYLNTVRKLAIFSLVSTFSTVTAFGRVVKDVSDGLSTITNTKTGSLIVAEQKF